MATTNFTADASQKSHEDYYCLTELAERRNSQQLTFLLALNLCVTVTAFLGNALILAALHKESSLHPPSKLLFRNLAITVGLIAGPIHVGYLISVLKEEWNICHLLMISCHITGYSLCMVSLLTLTAIGVDRLLALLLALRYKQVVTLKRIYVIIIVFWLVSITCSTMFQWSHYITLWFGYSVQSLCLVSSVFSCAKIFFTLRRNQVQAQGQQVENVLRNRVRYKKTVYSVLWMQLALVVCYLPNTIIDIVVLQIRLTPSITVAKVFAATLVYLNSSLNPILYCWKIREVRQAVRDTVKGLSCLSL